MATVETTTGEFWATTNTNTYVTAAFTPSAGELLVVVAGITGFSGGVATVSCAGSTGQTYYLAGRNSRSGSGHSQLIWVSNFSATAVAQTVTITLPASGTGAVVETFRVSGTTKRGASAVAQIAKITNGLVTAGDVTLIWPTAVNTDNPTVILLSLNSIAPLGPDGWTIAFNRSYGTPSTRDVFYTRDSGFAGTNVVWTESAATVFGVLGLEIDAGTAGDPTRTGTVSATDATDTFAGPGYVLVRGSVVTTDAPDTFSASGDIIVRGTLTATDNPDIFSASSYTLVRGSLAATDAADAFTAIAATRVTGPLSATDVADAFSATGRTIVQGTLAATDAADSLAAPGYVVIQGTFAATDQPDTFVALSGDALSVREATVAATDLADTFVAPGTSDASTGSAPPVVVVAATTNLGSGGGHNKRSYTQAPDTFWELRKQYLESLQPEIDSEPEPQAAPQPATDISPATVSPVLLEGYRLERQAVLTALPQVVNMRQLKIAGKRLKQLNRQIAEQKRLQEIEQAAIRKAERRAARIARRKTLMRPLKRKAVLLAAAEVAIALSHLYRNY